MIRCNADAGTCDREAVAFFRGKVSKRLAAACERHAPKNKTLFDEIPQDEYVVCEVMES